MKYWDEMLHKYGFDDGDSVPAGAAQYRRAYLLAVNAFAEEWKSTVRAIAYDRPGLHNWCLILFAPVDRQTHEHACDPDQLMTDAINEASTYGVDDYVHVLVTFDEAGLTDALVNRED